MRSLALVSTLLCGCTAVFGLEQPQHGAPDDARLVDSNDASTSDAPRDAATEDAPVVDALTCQPEFVSLGGSTTKYYHSVASLSWTAAETDCEARGAHLVVPGGAAEAQNLAMQLGSGPNLWIGLSDRKVEGSYRWVTDEDTGAWPPASGPPWGTGQPNGSATTDCIDYSISNGVGWHDRDCGMAQEYLCECDGYAANANNY